MSKKIGLLLRIMITIFAWFIGGYVLYKFEYLIAFNEIDNIIGMLPVAFVLIGAVGTTVIAWKKHTKQYMVMSAVIVLLIILSVLLFPTALRGNWWINAGIANESETKPDLSVYIPFSEGAKTVKLGEKSTLRLMEDLPVLDGAMAIYPIYAAFAEAVYDESAFSQEDVLCTNTPSAYKAIIAGERDVIFVAGASEQQRIAAEMAGVELRFTPIGREAFVFLVGQENPIENITYQQIRNIYSGKTANWQTLGWADGGRIIAFQRPEGSGSQTGLQVIMDELPLQVPQPLPDISIIGTNSLLKQVSVRWQGVQPALGYSYRYYATTMYANPDAKLLSINGVEPSIENIQNGSYPFVADFYAVTNGEPEGNTKLLIEWILSEQGQEIIEKTGYTPLMKMEH
jgi:ABC-type phosphate transport system, periplasmic component